MSETINLLEVIVWPTTITIFILIFRQSIKKVFDRISESNSLKANIGPVKLELGDLANKGQLAVDTLNRLNIVMAKSRLLELELIKPDSNPKMFSDQRETMKTHIEELKELVAITTNKQGNKKSGR